MTDRWFTDDELRELSRPTMDRAIEALDAGDVALALTGQTSFAGVDRSALYNEGAPVTS